MSEIPKPLLRDISDGRCLPFVGAGFSLNAKLPADVKMPDWKNLGAQFASVLKIKGDLAPPQIAERYQERFGRVQLIEEIRAALHPEKAKPGAAHSAFAMLPFDTVYTTNFDLLLEAAYSIQGRPFRSLVGELQMPFHAGQLASSIVKMHGDLRHEEHIIVTQVDYDSYLTHYPVIATHLAAMLITRTPLYIGYSLTDQDFVHIRSVIQSRLGTFERMAYVIQFDVTDDEIQKALAKRIHILSLRTSPRKSRDTVLMDFFSNIRHELDAISGSKFRASRPDVFEPIAKEIVEEAVESQNVSPVLAATSKLCFVLMPFSPEFDNVYRELIEPALASFGFKALRADEMSAPGAVIEQIRIAIQQAHMCIADVSWSNPNVMYELGLAQAGGKPTILLGQNVQRLPFDIQSQRIIQYDLKNLQAARLKLEAAINSVVVVDPLARSEHLLAAGQFRAAILEAFIVLESLLRKYFLASQKFKLRDGGRIPFSTIATSLEKQGVISHPMANKIEKVCKIRNKAVHHSEEPTQAAAEMVITTTKRVLASLGDE
jgi:hypothetical protein